MNLSICTVFPYAYVLCGDELKRSSSDFFAEELPSLIPDQSYDKIAVCNGPGSFTGIRIGLAYGMGLSRSLGVPLVVAGVFEAAEKAFNCEGSEIKMFANRKELFRSDGEIEQIEHSLAPSELIISGEVVSLEEEGNMLRFMTALSDVSDEAAPEANYVKPVNISRPKNAQQV